MYQLKAMLLYTNTYIVAFKNWMHFWLCRQLKNNIYFPNKGRYLNSLFMHVQYIYVATETMLHACILAYQDSQ